MAHNSRLISTACTVALDRRYHTDEERIEATQARFPEGTREDLMAAEFWAIWASTVIEQAEAVRSRELGERLLRRVRDQHRAVVGVR